MPITRPVILLLENDQADIFMFRRTLGRLGVSATVRTVGGVTDAIRYLENAGAYADRDYNPSPDLIVCDMKLFGSRGTDLLDWMRKQERFSTIPVVMLSGSAMPDEKVRSMALGAKAFIVKTGDINEATERLRQILAFLNIETAGAGRASDSPGPPGRPSGGGAPA